MTTAEFEKGEDQNRLRRRRFSVYCNEANTLPVAKYFRYAPDSTPAEWHQRQIRFYYTKIVFGVTESVLVHQIVFCCSRSKDFTPNRFLLHQNRFWYTRIRSDTPKRFLLQQIERFHARSISAVPNRFLLHQNRFCYTRIRSGTAKRFLL
jgi:hypothetical protein